MLLCVCSDQIGGKCKREERKKEEFNGMSRLKHIVRRNLFFQHKVNDGWVKSVDEERDLIVLLSTLETLKVYNDKR